jgi:hypothetical protein
MVARALGRLTYFDQLERYAYVGFGALQFRDFVLFHELGIEDMTSIEQEANIDRYRANSPYACIDVRAGTSLAVLPGLSWAKRTVVWLDYTGQLDADMLEDVRVVTDEAKSGGTLIVTVTTHEEKPLDDLPVVWTSRIGAKERFPGAKVPDKFALATAHKRAKWVRLILLQRIAAALGEVNAGVSNADDILSFEQVFFFDYRNGQPMTTVGGVFVSGKERDSFNRADFDSLDFVSRSNKPTVIKTPLLTAKEVLELKRQLPADPVTIDRRGVPFADVEAYAETYRYFPSFVEVEL